MFFIKFQFQLKVKLFSARLNEYQVTIKDYDNKSKKINLAIFDSKMENIDARKKIGNFFLSPIFIETIYSHESIVISPYILYASHLYAIAILGMFLAYSSKKLY